AGGGKLAERDGARGARCTWWGARDGPTSRAQPAAPRALSAVDPTASSRGWARTSLRSTRPPTSAAVSTTRRSPSRWRRRRATSMSPASRSPPSFRAPPEAPRAASAAARSTASSRGCPRTSERRPRGAGEMTYIAIWASGIALGVVLCWTVLSLRGALPPIPFLAAFLAVVAQCYGSKLQYRLEHVSLGYAVVFPPLEVFEPGVRIPMGVFLGGLIPILFCMALR